MSVTHVNFDFAFYFSMVLLVSLWNCGFMAITREGKIGHFALRWFLRQRPHRVYVQDFQAKIFDNELIAALKPFMDDPKTSIESTFPTVRAYLSGKNVFPAPGQGPEDIVSNLLSQVIYSRSGEVQGATDYPYFNRYYRYEMRRRIPKWVSDPIITCITCMASFHSLVLYTIVVLYKDFDWNPFEWAVLAIPVAFVGELLWFIKKKIQE